MAEYLTIAELRNYDVNGTSYDLAALVEAYELGTEPGRAPESIGEVKVGQVVYAWLMGARYRRGVVTKVGRTKVHVAYTTQGAIDSASQFEIATGVARGSQPVRVGNQPVALSFIRVIDAPAAAEPVQEVEDEEPTREEIEAEGQYEADKDAGVEDLTLHSQDGKVDTNSKDDEPEEPEMTAETQTTNATENHTGSTVVATLEKVWARIRADHPELPEVVIITGSGLVGGSKWGHFRAEGWKVREEGAAVRKHELFLAGEALAKGARQVLQTMLHEGAHTLAQVRQLQDTSRQGRWHNATFRKLAEEMGMEHKGSSADKSHGFSFVTLTTATVEKYADLLAELDREIRLVCHLPLWMGGTAEEEDDKGGEKIGKAPKGEGEDETKPKSGPLKATCACEEPVIIRVSQKVLDLGVVKCTECEELFRAA